jgi:hypothetical protein
MNRQPPWLLRSAVLGCVLLTLAAGALKGSLGGPRNHASVVEDTAAVTVPFRPDEAATLRILGSFGHWGVYREPEKTASTPQPAQPVAGGVGAEAVIRDYRLVGIESSEAGRSALLLPLAGTATGAASLLRLRTGDTLGEGASISSITSDAISVQTTSGSATLYLYGAPK